MNLLRILLVKDLQRIRRRPTAILIQIGMSMLIVGMIGLVFGGSGGGSGSGMAPIKMAIVDEDESILTRFLEGTASNPQMAEHFDVQFLERKEAMALIEDSELSAVLVFPEGMTSQYLEGGEEPLRIELIKNPAESVYPAIIEQGMEAVVTVLNALSRNFRDDIVALDEKLEEGLKEDALLWNAAIFTEVATDAMERLEAVKDYLNPPLVWFGSETRSPATGSGSEAEDEKEEERKFNLFAYIYVGLGCTFMLIISNSLTSDMYREGRFGTLRRFASIHDGSLPFVVEKGILVVVVTLIAAVVMFGGSALIFQFWWHRPLELSALILSFSICSAGLTSLLAGLAGKEKRADTINMVVVMGIAILGGGMLQAEMLPDAIRENITPYMPTAWFIGPAQAIERGAANVAWAGQCLKLLTLGAVCIVASSAIFHRRLLRGGVG